jgi:hypothetical protein
MKERESERLSRLGIMKRIDTDKTEKDMEYD